MHDQTMHDQTTRDQNGVGVTTLGLLCSHGVVEQLGHGRK